MPCACSAFAQFGKVAIYQVGSLLIAYGRLMRLPIFLVLLSLPGTALPHGGGLNAEGCHNNRKTGDYHCHRAGAAPAPQPLRSEQRQQGAYRNCSEARAAGAAPVRRGHPGYGPHLDRDGDGVGCES